MMDFMNALLRSRDSLFKDITAAIQKQQNIIHDEYRVTGGIDRGKMQIFIIH